MVCDPQPSSANDSQSPTAFPVIMYGRQVVKISSSRALVISLLDPQEGS